MAQSRNRKVQINQYFSTEKEPQQQSLKRTGRPELPDDIQAQLTGMGCRIRKSVSDGYQYKTSIPSYQGMTTGPVNTGSFHFSDNYSGGSVASKTQSDHSNYSRHKRSRSDEDNDTDVDEPLESTGRIYYAPKSASFESSIKNDFEEADFLVPKDEIMRR
jgi:hypothetical protein